MNTVLNLLPPNPTPPPPPATSNSTDSSDDTDFSQELNRAKSKPAHPAANSAQSTSTNKTATDPTAKKATADSTQSKTQANTQQKQQKSPDSSAEADADTQKAVQAQTTDSAQTAESDAESTAQVSTQAKALRVKAHPGLTGTPSPAASTSTTTSATKSTDSKSPQAAATSQTPTDPASLLAAAATQQSAPHPLTPPNPASSDTTDDAVENQIVHKPNVSPFKSTDSAGTSTDANTNGNAQAAEAAAQASAQLPTTGKAADSQAASSVAPLLTDSSAVQPPAPAAIQHAAPALPAAPPQTPAAQFAEANQPSMVSAITGTLLPSGGTMSIRLDPPELGALQITVRMENGVMSASFQTSNEQATRLLSHSLSQLKNALETQGVSVDRLHVHQAAPSEGSSNQNDDSDGNQKQAPGDRSAQQDQQRREVLRRMWRGARGDRDPLDLVA